jgi:hypothetical protein
MQVSGLRIGGLKADCIAAGAFAVAIASAARLVAAEVACPLDVTGVTVTPHVGTPGVRFRQPP